MDKKLNVFETILDFVKTRGLKTLRVFERKTFAWKNLHNLTTKKAQGIWENSTFESNEAKRDPMKACYKHRKGRVKKKKN